MPRIALLIALVLGSLGALAPAAPAFAQTITSEESQQLDAARAIIERIDREQEAQAESFSGLLALREQLDPARDDLRAIAGALQQRLRAAQAQLAEFGPAPGQGAPAEPPQNAAGRGTAQALATGIESNLRNARAVLVRADQLRDELTDTRRELFNSRIFQHQDSLVSQRFWGRVFGVALPQFGQRLRAKWLEIRRGIDVREGWTGLTGIAGFLILLSACMAWLHRRLAWRRWQSAASDVAGLTRAQIVTHAFIVLAMHALPFLAAALAIGLTVTYLEMATEEVEYFLLGVAGALAAFGFGNGAVRAVFAPDSAVYRLLRTTDPTAQRAVTVLRIMLAIYLAGLITLGIVEMVSADVSLTIATSGLTAAAIIVAGAMLLFKEPASGPDTPVSGLIQAPMHLLRPIFWMLAAAITGALLLGFIALAGFISGRAIATLVVLCLATLTYVAIEAIFHDAIAPDKPANRTIAATFGVRPETVDLAGTIVAGTLRVLTVIFTILILLSPWGIEFGNLNPFADVFFGVRFSDLRGWIGAAGIAIILFTAGLIATRLFVAWLNNQLLPRTTLNTGVRHSVSTIAGYIGFVAAFALALGQAGVQLQNVALVAGALSVGIGFGLQQVVSNFVAGLIVLAERPIRVGDIISVRGEEGKVQKISVRATEILLGENSTVIVPNAEIVSSIVKNRSFNDPTHRATVKLIVSHEVDIKTVFDTLLAVAGAHKHVLKTPAPVVYIVNVTEYVIELDLHVICGEIKNISAVRSDLYYDALVKFREAGIKLAGGVAPIAQALVPPMR